MPREFARHQRLGNQVLRTLSEVLRSETKDPRLRKVSLTRVDLSRDLGIARIYFSLLDPEQPVEPVLEGLERVRLSPLGGALGPFRVADLETGRRINEMRFDLTLGLVRAEALASVFTAHPGGDVRPDYGPALAALPVASRGFLTGSVDLVFEAPDPAGGRRWWVLDWKSNWLGRRDSEGNPLACGPRHYGPAAMAELMVRNHYVLQAHLYLVALHRYLRWRRPGYRPEDHQGGYAYA